MVTDEDLVAALGVPKGSMEDWLKWLAQYGGNRDPHERKDLVDLALEELRWPPDPAKQRAVREGMRSLLTGAVAGGSAIITLWVKAPAGLSFEIAECVAKHQKQPWRAIPPLLTGEIKQSWEQRLSLERFTDSELARELASPATDLVRLFTALPEAQRIEILLALREHNPLWTNLPGHHDQNKRLSTAAELVREDVPPVPACLRNEVRILMASEDPKLAQLQTERISAWSHTAQLRWALGLVERAGGATPELADAMLEALAGGAETLPIRDRLKKARWLPLKGGGFGRPCDLITLSSALVNILIELSEQAQDLEVGQSAFFLTESDLDLPPLLLGALAKVLELGEKDPSQSLPALVMRLEEVEQRLRDPLVVVGSLPLPITPSEVRSVHPLAVLPLGWRFLIACLDHLSVTDLNNWSELRPEVQAMVVGTVTPARVKGWIKDYRSASAISALPLLRTLMNELGPDGAEARSLLLGLSLPNADGEWVPCDQLTTWSDAPAAHRLHPDLMARLRHTVVVPQYFNPGAEQADGGPPLPQDLERATLEVPALLERWGMAIPGGSVSFDVARGVLLSLMGDRHRAKASELLRRWKTVDGVREAFRIGDRRVDPIDPLWERHLAEHQLGLRTLQPEGVVHVPSLTGGVLCLPLSSKLTRGLFEGLSEPSPQGDGDRAVRPRWLSLRAFDGAQRGRELTLTILKDTAHFLFVALTGGARPGAGASVIWAHLLRTEQVDLSTAINLLREELPHQLKVLQVRDLERAEARQIEMRLEALSHTEDRRREIEMTLDYPGKPTELLAQVNAVQKARRDLSELVCGDPDVRSFVLQCVRRKVEGVQYDQPRVPFELFQNADDAVGQLTEMEAVEGLPIDLSARTFRLAWDRDLIDVTHWGRLVNQVRTGPLFNMGADRGYHRDLLHMLAFGESDKVVQREATGKFGLGFKSCYLVSDTPEVQSGSLSFKVVGGVLPEAIGVDEHLLGVGNGQRFTPTRVRLPLREVVVPEQVLSDMLDCGGLLAIFGRHIRRVEVRSGDHVPVHARWEPNVEELGETTTFEVGELPITLRAPADPCRLLVLRARRDGGAPAVLVLKLGKLGKLGPEKMPDGIPTLWVTAPLKIDWRLGWCLGGDFQVDPGRAQLGQTSGQREHNLREADRIGEVIHAMIEALVSRPGLWQRLGVPDESAKGIWWSHLWRVLREGLETKEPALMPRTELLGRIRDQWLPAVELLRVIPTELHGRWRALTNRDSIRSVAEDDLASDAPLCAEVSSWTGIADKWPPGSVVAPEVAHMVRKTGLPMVSVVECIKRLIEVSSPEAGDLRWRALRFVVGRWASWSQPRKEEAQGLIRGVEFPTASDEHKPASELVLGELPEPTRAHIAREAGDSYALSLDERRLAPFAPLDRRLSNAALQSFDLVQVYLEARQRGRETLPLGIAVIAGWARRTPDAAAQAASLVYLCQGDRRDELARALRGEDPILPWAPDRATLIAGVPYRSLSADDRATVLRMLFPRSLEEEEGSNGSPPSPQSPPQLEPALLASLADRWPGAEFDPFRRKLHEREWPNHWHNETRLREALGSEDDSSEAADAWLSLLTLGAARSLGRSQPEAHAGYLNRLKQNGSWDRLVLAEGDLGRSEWIEVLEVWEDGLIDNDSFRLWMRLYATIHQLRRFLWVYRRMLRRVGDAAHGGHGLGYQLSPLVAMPGAGVQFAAPPLPLNIGRLWVLRELRRLGVLERNSAARWCWFADGQVRRLLGIERGDSSPEGLSMEVHEKVALQVGHNEDFDGWHDAALRALYDPDIRHSLAQDVDWSGADAQSPEDEAFDSRDVPLKADE